jgi:hypothetical protein
MALFSWLTETQESCLLSYLQDAITGVGMIVDASVSNSNQVYAVDEITKGIAHCSRVRLIASWTDRSTGELKIELMSSESQLLKGTRCESMMTALQQAFPPA